MLNEVTTLTVNSNTWKNQLNALETQIITHDREKVRVRKYGLEQP